MNEKNRILLITDAIGPIKSLRYQNLFSSLDNNVEIVILSYWPISYKFDRVCKITSIKSKQKSYITSIISNRIPIFPDSYNVKIKEFKNQIKKLLLTKLYNNCIISMSPYSLIKLSKIIKEINPNIFIIGDMLDPFSFNMKYKSKINIKMACVMERKYFPFYDSIIVLNEMISDRYQYLYPEFIEKFQVIEYGVDEDFINKIKSYPENLSNSFTFLYAGSFYKKGRNPNNIYEAFSKMQKKCKLYIYGNYKMVLHPPKNSSISYNHSVNRDELAKITASANALVIVDNEYGYQVPGKTIETLATGKPILFIYNNEQSPTLKYVKEARGVVWAKNNKEDIIKGIETIIAGDYEKPYFDYSSYTWDKLMKKYKELLYEG